MTTRQRITLMADWWPKACAAQGWDKNDRAIRMQVLSKAVGRQIHTANALNNTDDLGRVKNYLLMLADNVSATVETDHPEMDRARRLRFAIREQLKCLAVYMNLDVGLADYTPQQAAEDFLAAMIRDKFQHGARANVLRPLTVEDLSAEIHEATGIDRHGRKKQERSELDQILWALARSLRQHRKARGHSIHDMRIAAGLKCNCSQCCKFRRAPVAVPAMVPAGPEEDPNPF